MLDCNCPADVLTTISYNPCPEVPSKDARWVFQVADDANNTFINGTNGIEVESSWTNLTTAPDDTKVVVTPFLEEVTFAEVDALEDSENFDGAPNAVAPGPQLVTAVMRNVTPEQFDAMTNLKCRDNALSFYRIDSNGKIGARKIGNNHAGILISPQTLLVLSPNRGSTLADHFKTTIRFYLASDWYSTFDLVTPETGFNPLTEIRP